MVDFPGGGVVDQGWVVLLDAHAFGTAISSHIEIDDRSTRRSNPCNNGEEIDLCGLVYLSSIRNAEVIVIKVADSHVANYCIIRRDVPRRSRHNRARPPCYEPCIPQPLRRANCKPMLRPWNICKN